MNEDLKGNNEPNGEDESGTEPTNKTEESSSSATPQTISLLKENATQEETDAFYNALGRPQKAEDYKINVLDGQDDSFAKAIAPVLHKYGITARQAEGLSKDYNDIVIAMQAERNKAAESQSAAEEAELKKELGAQYNSKIAGAQRAVKFFEFSADDITALENIFGYKNIMKKLIKIGESFSEDKIGGAGQASGAEAQKSFAGIMFPDMPTK